MYAADINYTIYLINLSFKLQKAKYKFTILISKMQKMSNTLL